mmetsp:Transcript_3003/g.6654  ORF Transcript_3003/g.6654 Transcript_3003/m.6654 type:complete len:412 (+) Transcript_3003:153-1388(+)|eukprot:CAMPEP_0178396072 /NCGR_PEP_ID=MMETSP0689_2-20121128/13544_1 /TAXON_ID=160604 /ORGANISM="Amphidinium massartii, Strain CS-259" /LENGTH=411 /DNA_ID=CAMNT_0020016743 /DNA_START=112 /DNA_END=1347 /DNA_ORIENTATION=-
MKNEAFMRKAAAIFVCGCTVALAERCLLRRSTAASHEVHGTSAAPGSLSKLPGASSLARRRSLVAERTSLSAPGVAARADKSSENGLSAEAPQSASSNRSSRQGLTRLLQEMSAVLKKKRTHERSGGRADELLCQIKESSLGREEPVMEFLRSHRGWTSRPKRCALVSSSGVLLKHSHGSLIDASDLVIRFNDAQVGGQFTAQVGERDDVRLLNANFHTMFLGRKLGQSMPFAASNHTLFVMQRLDPARSQAMWTSMEEAMAEIPSLHIILGNLTLPKHSNCVLDAGMHPTHSKRRRRSCKEEEAMFSAMGDQQRISLPTIGIPSDKVTTGFMGGLLALSLCDEVWAYGFADTPAAESSAYHYYGPPQALSEKAADREKLFWRAVAMNDDVERTDIAKFPGFRRLACDEAL